MIQQIKVLIVVLGIVGLLFYFGKPLLLRFSTAEDIDRRRNLYMAISVVAFLSPSFWLFVFITAMLLLWASKRDSNPAALYLLLLHVIPPTQIKIPPPPGMNEVFGLDNYRLLAFTLLVPAALRLRRVARLNTQEPRKLTAVDWCFMGWALLNIVVFIPPDLPGHVILPDSFTNVVRRVILFGIDVGVLYYVISRSSTTWKTLSESMAWLCMGCVIMAGTACFEAPKGWLLYNDMFSRWDPSIASGYLLRDGALRASATAGPPLVLGVLLAAATGLWLALMPRFDSVRTRLIVMAVLWAGLVASYSRGPWLGAIAIYIVYTAVGPRAMSRVLKGAVVAGALGLAVLASPLGDRIIKVMPMFGGSVDNYNVLYRQHLAELQWRLILDHPFFGDRLAYFKMDEMRQGEGLIDLVNSFTSITLFYGFVGLFFVLGFILLGAYRTWRQAKRLTASAPEASVAGFALVGTIAGTLIMLWGSSFFAGSEKLFYILGGFAAGYARLTVGEQALAQPAKVARRKAWDPIPAGSLTARNVRNQI